MNMTTDAALFTEATDPHCLFWSARLDVLEDEIRSPQ
jgi:hypothetical protein